MIEEPKKQFADEPSALLSRNITFEPIEPLTHDKINRKCHPKHSKSQVPPINFDYQGRYPSYQDFRKLSSEHSADDNPGIYKNVTNYADCAVQTEDISEPVK